MGKQWKQWLTLFRGDSKITADGDCSHEIKRCLLLGRKVMTNLDSIYTHIYKASGHDEIPAELFQILKDDAVKVLHSTCLQIWKIQQWPQDWKMLVFIPVPKKGNAKECSNYCAIALISYARKVTLKILQA